MAIEHMAIYGEITHDDKTHGGIVSRDKHTPINTWWDSTW